MGATFQREYRVQVPCRGRACLQRDRGCDQPGVQPIQKIALQAHHKPDFGQAMNREPRDQNCKRCPNHTVAA